MRDDGVTEGAIVRTEGWDGQGQNDEDGHFIDISKSSQE